jgi:hypothetical protein
MNRMYEMSGFAIVAVFLLGYAVGYVISHYTMVWRGLV